MVDSTYISSGITPDTFHTKPTIEEFESTVKRAVARVTNRHGNQMISPSEVTVKEPYHEVIDLNGAGTKIRTRDLLITNQLLYQLSYTGTGGISGGWHFMC